MSRGDQPKPIRTICGACNGKGGNWQEYAFYDKKSESMKTVRKWVPCPTCGGMGFLNY